VKQETTLNSYDRSGCIKARIFWYVPSLLIVMSAEIAAPAILGNRL
jgi:hypothetical protein